ncbi:hypothetical protein PG993_003768 [Apiospora rasikravindrae]|uniref:Uncharacterized protein n=1 Tax=Apiospora rasikravindrae TaxID=990691 RepID=A0ABR1U357_9PEZI
MDRNNGPALAFDEEMWALDNSLEALFEVDSDNDLDFPPDADTDANADADAEAALDADFDAAFAEVLPTTEEVPEDVPEEAPEQSPEQNLDHSHQLNPVEVSQQNPMEPPQQDPVEHLQQTFLEVQEQNPVEAPQHIPVEVLQQHPGNHPQQNPAQGIQPQPRQEHAAMTQEEMAHHRQGINQEFTPLFASMNHAYSSYPNWLAIENVTINPESNDRELDGLSVDDQELVRRLYVAYRNTTDTFEGKRDGSFSKPITKALTEVPDLDLQMLCWRQLRSIYQAQAGMNGLPVTYTTKVAGNGQFDNFMARFETVEVCLRTSKLMCKDLLCGDEYMFRLAWNPVKELKRKNQNMDGNLKREVLLRVGNVAVANRICEVQGDRIVAKVTHAEAELGSVKLPDRSDALKKAMGDVATRTGKTDAAKAQENLGIRRENASAGPSRPRSTRRTRASRAAAASGSPVASASSPSVEPAATQPRASPEASAPAASTSRARPLRPKAKPAAPKPTARTSPTPSPAALPAAPEVPMLQAPDSQGHHPHDVQVRMDRQRSQQNSGPAAYPSEQQAGPSSLNRPLPDPIHETQDFGTRLSPSEAPMPIDPALQQQMGHLPDLPTATAPAQYAEPAVPQIPQPSGSVPPPMAPSPRMQQQQQQPAAARKNKGKRKVSEAPQADAGDQGGSNKRRQVSGTPSAQQSLQTLRGQQGLMNQGGYNPESQPGLGSFFNPYPVQAGPANYPNQFPIQGERSFNPSAIYHNHFPGQANPGNYPNHYPGQAGPAYGYNHPHIPWSGPGNLYPRGVQSQPNSDLMNIDPAIEDGNQAPMPGSSAVHHGPVYDQILRNIRNMTYENMAHHIDFTDGVQHQ